MKLYKLYIYSFMFCVSSFFSLTLKAQLSFDQEMEQAYALEQAGNIERASTLYEKILLKFPQNTLALYNYAHTLKDLNAIDKAIIAYQKAITLDPEHVFAHFGLGQCYGLLFDYEKAFPLLEWRSNSIKDFQKSIEFLKQAYTNNYSLAGITILVRAEWGLGDNIQFIRYAKLLHDRGAKIIMQSYKELQPLFSLCSFIDTIISEGDAFPAHHIQIPLLSLPYVCSITKNSCSPHIPYLKVSEALQALWQDYISTYTTFTIGMCWHGNGNPKAPPLLNKNISFSILSSLVDVPNTTIFSLQKMKAEAHSIHGVITFNDQFDVAKGRFMDTAAVMQSLHLIISIDTSIAHLAGALGRPVWLLLPYHSDWRWGAYGDTSPFYPTMRIFRQKKPGDWHSVIQEVKEELKKVI